MALESLAHEAHHMAEQIGPKEKGMPRGRKVDPTQHATGKAISGAIQGALLYAAIGAASLFFMSYVGAGLGGAGLGLSSLQSAFGFVEGGFEFSKIAVQMVGLPLLGATIKGVTSFMKGQKEAEAHNARVEGKSTGHAKGRGHEVEAGTVVTAVPGLADKEPEWHPANDRPAGHSFVSQHRPDGPITGAEKVAEMVRQERAAQANQSV